VLEPLVLQPPRQEGGVGVEVGAVDVDPGGVPAIHQDLVQRRTTAAQRVEHAQPVGEHPSGAAGGQHGDVEQELGEQLVGLARILQDREQVVVEAVQSLERHRPEGLVAGPFEQRERGGDVREMGQARGVEVTLEGHVVDAREHLPGRLAEPTGQHGLGEHAELGNGQRCRGPGVDPVRGRRHEQRVRAHGGRD
jgi:hypothetical protein